MMASSNLTQFVTSLIQRRTLLLLLCFIAFVLRLFHLETQSFWYDEGFSAWLSAQSFEQIVARTGADIHPPLYYFLLHVWIALCGQTEFALRYFSLLPGVLLVPAFFVLTRRLFDETTAWIAAILALLSPLYIWYAQEARMYMLLTLLTLLSSYIFLRWMERPTWASWLAFSLCNVLAVYLHFFAFFVVAFQMLYFFIWWVRQETRWGILLAGIASGLLVLTAYVPWARIAFQRLAADLSYFEGTLPLLEVLRKTFVMFVVGHSVLEPEAIPLAIVFCLLAVFGWLAATGIRSDLLKAQREDPFHPVLAASTASRLFLLLYLLVPFLLLYLVAYDRPKFHPRYLMIASPPFLILIAAGMADLLLYFWQRERGSAPRRFFALAMASLIAIFVGGVSLSADANLYFDPRFSKDDFRGVAAAIKANRAPGEPTILVSGHLFPVYQYYDPQGTWIALPDEPTLSTQRVLGYNVANDLNAALRNKSGAWLVLWQNDVVDPSAFVTTILDTQAKRLPPVASFWGVELLHYQIPPGTVFADKPQIQKPLTANFDGQIELLGYNLPATPSPVDKGLNITLFWRALVDLKKDYNVALRVRDGEGNLLGRLDARPGNYNYPTNRWRASDLLFGKFQVPLEMATPPGNYQLEVTLYSADEPEGLNVLDVAGNPSGKFVVLQPIPLERATAQPTLDKLKLKHPMRFDFASTIEMLGFELDRTRAEPGEPINITVYWRAVRTPSKDYQVGFQLRASAQDETLGAPTTLNELVPAFPTSKWRQGDIVRAQYAYYLPTDASVGERTLRLTLIDPTGNPVAAYVGLGDIRVEPSTRTFRQPNPLNVEITQFDGVIQLHGYDTIPPAVIDARNPLSRSVSLSAGGTLTVTLYWRDLQRVRTPYNVFVHLRRDGVPIIVQRDSAPVNGTRPTPTWLPGEYIADRYGLKLPADTPPGTYFVEVGLYEPRTGQRLPIGSSPASRTSGAPSSARLNVSVVVR